jgi:hypothetical protein
MLFQKNVLFCCLHQDLKGKTKKSQSLCRFIFSFFFDRFFNWSANEFITKNDSRRNLNNVTQVEVRIYYYFFKNKFHNWKKKKCFCRLADGCFDLSAVDSDPIGGLKVRVGHGRPAVPRCQPNHIIITDGYFIVGDMIKQIFSLKKQNKKWNCLFLIFGWFHNKSITRYYFRFVFFSTSAFYLIGERINKKKSIFRLLF